MCPHRLLLPPKNPHRGRNGWLDGYSFPTTSFHVLMGTCVTNCFSRGGGPPQGIRLWENPSGMLFDNTHTRTSITPIWENSPPASLAPIHCQPHAKHYAPLCLSKLMRSRCEMSLGKQFSQAGAETETQDTGLFSKLGRICVLQYPLHFGNMPFLEFLFLRFSRRQHTT